LPGFHLSKSDEFFAQGFENQKQYSTVGSGSRRREEEERIGATLSP
jgi:hypothetical protein